VSAAPVGLVNTLLPLAGLAALAAGLAEVLTPRGTLSQRRLALAVAAAAAATLLAGAALMAALQAGGGAHVVAALAARPLATAAYLVASVAPAGLVWGPLLALVWLVKAQGVERRRGEARVREGRP